MHASRMRSSLLLALATFASAANCSLPIVTLDYCKVQAAAVNKTVGFYKYQNIRYAAVPTGDLRWAEPRWPPIKTIINNGSLAVAGVDCSITEDCLYLDVWAPTNSAGKKLPVMVFTYGGRFAHGTKLDNTPEGLFDLSTEFIFVGYNYRLGMAGVANGISLTHDGGIANVGLYDVTQAFQWVRKYISKFGGNPEAITAVGFSAGASQTLFQMTRFAGRNEQLFSQAYVMSPGYVPAAGHYQAELFWQNVSTAVGCPGGSVSCMRNVSFSTLQSTATSLSVKYAYTLQPRVDGLIIADTYESQFYQKRFNFSGPIVLTHEAHETNQVPYPTIDNASDVAAELKIYFPSITDGAISAALALYPESDYSSASLRFADIEQSLDITAHNLAVTNALKNQTWNALVNLKTADHGTDQSYYWYSTYNLSTATTTKSNSTSTSSVAYTSPTSFGVKDPGFKDFSAINTTVAIMMQKYLLSFVITGNPNTLWPKDKLEWPMYTNSSVAEYTNLVINETFSLAADDLATEKSLFWNKALWY